MANEREEGLAALQNGDFATAQTKLEAAIAADPRDPQAHLYLGGVYHQQGRHTDAVRVLTTATQLMPISSQAQYNLGIALEAQGSHAQALDAYRRALALQGDYPLAQQGVERMQKAVQAAPPTGMYGAAPASTGYEATTHATAYAAPAAPAYGTAPPAQPYMQDQTQPVSPYAAPPAQPGYTAPDVQPGYAQPTNYGQPQQYDLAGNPIAPTQPTYGQAAPGGYAPPPGPAGYQGQQWSPYPAQGQMAKEDRFDVVQAFKDWAQILIAPKRFFDSEEGAAGFSAPLSQLLAYSVIVGIAYFVMMTVAGSGSGMGIGIGAIAMVIAIPLMFVCMALGTLIWAGIVHMVSRMFAGSGEYSGSFRAVVYANAPGILLSCAMVCVMGFFMPKPARIGMAEPTARLERAQYTNPSSRSPFGQQPFGSPGYGNPGTPGYGNARTSGFGSPYGSSSQMPTGMGMFGAMWGLQMLVNLAAFVWSAILLGMGMRATQRLTTGGAVGTVIVSYIIVGVIVFVIAIGMVALFAGMMSSMH